MTEKVFLPAFGNKPKHIIGRQGLIENFLEGLSEPVGHPNRSTILIGQRGTGKTTLLLEFAELAQEADYVCARVMAHEDMLEEIIDQIQVKGAKYLATSKQKISGFSAGAAGFSLGLSFTQVSETHYGPRMKLSLLCEELTIQGKGVVILVDEVQPDAKAVRILAGAYQHLLGEGMNISLVMAGLPSSMSSVLNDDILTFLNRANKVVLDPIPQVEIFKAYAEEFAYQGISVEPQILDKIAAATKGYPYLYQLIGYHLLSLLPSSKVIDLSLANQAIHIARAKMVDNIFAPVLKPLSKKDKDFLEAMSVDEGSSSVADIQARLGVTKGYVQTYRTRLIEAKVISSAGHGELEFAVPYLGEYLRGDF
ncbi:MAG: ATP-binding protein [Coriobacteriia bacterium]|nr:ATP-binding protein [Coriobacteriia bacterium]